MIKIMLVEDHIVVRDGLKELIQNEKDMRVICEAGSGEEAISLLKKNKPKIIIMDISLPEMSGIEAIKLIKKSYPGIKILVLSAYDNEEFVFEVINSQAAGYLLKNADGSEIIRAIRSVNDGDVIFHSSITKKILKKLPLESNAETQAEKQNITKRELEVISLGAKGYKNKKIADLLDLSERTIQTHWRNICIKLNVNSKISAIMKCVKYNWIEY